MRYDQAWEALAERAVAQGGVDVETFIRMGANSGMSLEQIEQRLVDDVMNDGPVFGKFMRSLQGAATASVRAAARQATTAADALAEGFLTEADLDAALDGADPEALQEIEEAVAEAIEYTWVATLQNTCYRCLPLHGRSLTLDEWRAVGFLPETAHEGWTSTCKCTLVPRRQASVANDLRSPLVRKKVESADGSKKTMRAVAQQDLDRALAAVQHATKDERGRRTLRLMGQAED